MVLMCMVVLLCFFQSNVMAQSVIVYRSRSVKITKPDGTIISVEKGDPLPRIPSGSIIEVLEGALDITCLDGFVQVVVADSVATVEKGDRIIASLDRDNARFKVVNGQVDVVTGNTTTTIKLMQVAMLRLDKRAGNVEVKSLKGTIETMTIGVIALIPKNAMAQISVASKTREVNVECLSGEIEVVSTNGEKMTLAKGKSVNISGFILGKIQTFGEDEADELDDIPEDEPTEPEVPEGSPHRP